MVDISLSRVVRIVSRWSGSGDWSAASKSSPIPGWKTDRGRIYIILGEPNDIQHFESGQETYPAEVWFYQNKGEFGLPSGFNIVFFKEHGSGDYKLYSPVRDGPQAFLANYVGDVANVNAAYRKLRDLEPNLAMVSLSLIPGEDSTGGRLVPRRSLAMPNSSPSSSLPDALAAAGTECRPAAGLCDETWIDPSDNFVGLLKGARARPSACSLTRTRSR
jgi:hypothetical protein